MQPSSLPARAAAIRAFLVDLDRQVDEYSAGSGLSCPPGCGHCCNSPTVEVSVADWLPEAFAIVDSGRLDTVLSALNSLEEAEDGRCVYYSRAERFPGRCTSYATRPSLCRLFGYAIRHDRLGKREPVSCAVHKTSAQPALAILAARLASGTAAPEFSAASLALLGMEPELGSRLLPINAALREAIHIVALQLSYAELEGEAAGAP